MGSVACELMPWSTCFPGIQVDGNDVIAVRHAIEGALERARSGGGATLVEAVTYRLSDHTTVDDASRYRDDAEVSARWKDEPILRLRKHLTTAGAWTKEDEERLIADCGKEVEAAAETYLATPAQPAESMFDWLYDELPGDLAEQRASLAPEAGGTADG